MQLGSEIYYTGDMANHSGWFKVTGIEQPGHCLTLQELPGGDDREFTVYGQNVGREYHGHCNPRFVTRAAYDAYRNQRMCTLGECA